MSRDPYAPSDPSAFSRPVGTVGEALDDLAANAGGGVTDHGALTGLGDDDHTQYLLGPVAGYSTGGFLVATDSTDRELQQSGASIDGFGNLNLQGGDLITSTGDIIIGGLVDGRDVSADGAKLDGIEAGADVTDAANVEAAGAVMDSDFGAAGIMTRLGASGSYAARTITGGTGITVTNGDGAGGNPTIDADFGDTVVAEWGDPTSTSAASFFIGRHGITNPGGNATAFYRVPFEGTLTRLVLVANVTAVARDPRLGALIYRATSPGGVFGLLEMITTSGTVVSGTGSNITTDVSLSSPLSEGDCLSIAYLRSGTGTTMTVNNLRAFMTIEAK